MFQGQTDTKLSSPEWKNKRKRNGSWIFISSHIRENERTSRSVKRTKDGQGQNEHTQRNTTAREFRMQGFLYFSFYIHALLAQRYFQLTLTSSERYHFTRKLRDSVSRSTFQFQLHYTTDSSNIGPIGLFCMIRQSNSAQNIRENMYWLQQHGPRCQRIDARPKIAKWDRV